MESRFNVFARALMIWTFPGTYPRLGMIRSSDGDHFQGPEPAPRFGISGMPNKGHLAGKMMSSAVNLKGMPCLRALYRASLSRVVMARRRVWSAQALHGCLPLLAVPLHDLQGRIICVVVCWRAWRLAVLRLFQVPYEGAYLSPHMNRLLKLCAGVALGVPAAELGHCAHDGYFVGVIADQSVYLGLRGLGAGVVLQEGDIREHSVTYHSGRKRVVSGRAGSSTGGAIVI